MATAAIPEPIVLAPQPGPQEQFLASRCDVAFLGGSVYGGKSWALTFQPVAHVGNPGFTCVTFRRTAPDIRNPGSLWDESMKMYPLLDADPREQPMEWRFPSGALVKYAGLQYEADVLSWKSSQIALVQFDQVEEFTEAQFWYMQSRNRTSCGVSAYTRATCNALADTWVAAFIAWWWDAATGYAIPERSGVARWFVRIDDTVHWATPSCRCDAPAEVFAATRLLATTELEAAFPGRGRFARSFTFIRALLEDNTIGVAADPEYEARVRTLSLVEQERLLGGNWKIRAAAGLVFDRAWFDIVDAVPAAARRARFWDKAATAGAGDWTVGVRMSEAQGIYYVEHVERSQWSTFDRERVIKQTAQTDPHGTVVGEEQEPGSGGVDSARMTIQNLAGVAIWAERPTGQLVERAQPLSAQAGARNVKLVRGPWNEAYLRELHAFPTKGVNDDQVSASAGAFKLLTRPRQPLSAPSTSYVSVG